MYFHGLGTKRVSYRRQVLPCVVLTFQADIVFKSMVTTNLRLYLLETDTEVVSKTLSLQGHHLGGALTIENNTNVNELAHLMKVINNIVGNNNRLAVIIDSRYY